MFVKADVSSESDVSSLVEKTSSAYGWLDAAFNNAGIEGDIGKQTHEQSIKNYRAVMDINVLGVLLAMKHEVSAILKKGWRRHREQFVGRRVGWFSGSGYLRRQQARRDRPHKDGCTGIRNARFGVNAMSPGGIETPMFDRFTAAIGGDTHDQMAATHPIGRTGRPEEIAEAVLWLCSDKASFVTGHTLVADGSWTAK